MKVKRTFWIVVILVVASLFGAIVWGSKVYSHLIYVWAVLVISSYFWTVVSLRGIQVQRQTRTQRQQVGQVFEERFEVDNHSRLGRLWVSIQDKGTLIGSGGSRVLSWIGGGQQRSYISYTWLTHRGSFLLGPTKISSGDLFGLFSVSREIASNKSLLVTPYFVELQSFPNPAGLLPGGRTQHRRTLEVTPYAAGVREYAPGDALSRIHWPSTARRNQLMVKEFEQDPQADVWILVDAHKFVQAALPDAYTIRKGENVFLWRRKPEEVRLPSATIEYAVSAAASIANYYIIRGYAVGLATAGQIYTVLPAERGERQLGKILEVLAFIEGEGKLPLYGLVTAQAGTIPRGSTVILITSSVQSEVLLASGELERRGLQPVVVLINAGSFGGAVGSKDLAAEMIARNIPTLILENHQDIRLGLQPSALDSSAGRGWWNDNV
jgi:uncharacterized protein (DUF58 family)